MKKIKARNPEMKTTHTKQINPKNVKMKRINIIIEGDYEETIDQESKNEDKDEEDKDKEDKDEEDMDEENKDEESK